MFLLTCSSVICLSLVIVTGFMCAVCFLLLSFSECMNVGKYCSYTFLHFTIVFSFVTPSGAV